MDIGVLEGEVNRDGAVDLIDVAAVKTYNRAAVDAGTYLLDANADGKINLIDAAFVRSRYGDGLPLP